MNNISIFLKIRKNYKKIINKLHDDFSIYVILGIVTTILNVISYYVLREFLNLNIVLSYIIAWVISVLFAFFSNRKTVFHSTSVMMKHQIVELINFTISRIATGLLGIIIIKIGIHIYKNDLIWNVLQMIVVVILNYVISKIFVFKKKHQSKWCFF